MPLQSNLVRVKNVADMTLVQNVFYLITPTRTFTFMGKDPDEKDDWMTDLNRCISTSAAAGALRLRVRTCVYAVSDGRVS